MIEVIFETEIKNSSEIEQIIKSAADYALMHEKINASVCVTVVDKERIRQINREFRNIDKVTDVLSFPAWDGSCFDITDGYLGDIAICIEKAYEQADEYGHSFLRELSFLTIHGMLHIMGYDHIEKADEALMFSTQNEILNLMGIER